jgi:hypothetical protein
MGRWTGRYESGLRSMHPPKRCRSFQLPDGINNPVPDRNPRVVTVRCVFLGPSDALRFSGVAVPPQHQVSSAPDVDLGYHRQGCYARHVDNRLTGRIHSSAKVALVLPLGKQAVAALPGGYNGGRDRAPLYRLRSFHW